MGLPVGTSVFTRLVVFCGSSAPPPQHRRRSQGGGGGQRGYNCGRSRHFEPIFKRVPGQHLHTHLLLYKFEEQCGGSERGRGGVEGSVSMPVGSSRGFGFSGENGLHSVSTDGGETCSWWVRVGHGCRTIASGCFSTPSIEGSKIVDHSPKGMKKPGNSGRQMNEPPKAPQRAVRLWSAPLWAKALLSPWAQV